MKKLSRLRPDDVGGRIARRTAALAVLSMLALAPAALANSGPYTWSGAAGGGAANWSSAGNWGGTAPTTPATGSFDFPALNCSGSVSCNSINNLSGTTTATGLTIDDGTQYLISGSPITLDPTSPTDGITASPTGTPSGTATISAPLVLQDDQTWSVAGTGTPGSGDLAVSGNITTPGSSTLGVSMIGGSLLTLSGSDSVGAFTASGGDTSDTGYDASDNGDVTVNSDLNSGGAPVSFSDVTAQLQPQSGGTLHLGALTLTGADATIGQSDSPAGDVSVAGPASMDTNTDTNMSVATNNTNPVAGTDYSQLKATGNITVDGTLSLLYGGGCSSLTPGTTYTLIQSTGGTRSGAFNNLANGAEVDAIGFCNSQLVSIPMQISYTGTSVTAMALGTSTASLAASPTTAITNQPVTLTATVTQSSGTPAGTVEFDNYGSISGCTAQPVTNGTATCTTTFEAAQGQFGLTAQFTPTNPDYATSDYSSPLSITVNPDNSTTTLQASSTSPVAGSSVTYRVAVSPVTYPNGPALPYGTVEFLDGTTPITCSGQNDGYLQGTDPDTTTCTTTYATAGSHTITAQYQSDGDFNSSSSAAVPVTVTAAPAPGPTPTPTPAPAPTPAPTPGTGTPHVGNATSSGTSASLPVGCPAGGASCTVKLVLTITEKVKVRKGKKVTTVKETITIGTATTTVTAGKSTAVKVSLNGTGKRLLAADRRLTTKLTVTRRSGGKTKTVSAKTVSFKAKGKAKKNK